MRMLLASGDRRMSPGILFVAPWLFDGGVERVMEQKARWFAARGYRVRIAVAELRATLSGHPNPVLARFQALGIPVTVLPVYGPRLHITQRALGIAGQALRNGIRILVGHDLLANLEVLVAKRMLKSRVRVIAEGHISLKFPDTGIDPLTLARARRLLPTADGIVAVSNGIRRELIDYYRVSPAKVATFYNVFRPGEIRRLAEEPAPETAGRAPFIVACGRFVEAKGLSDLIRAFARVRARRPLTLVLLGDGPAVLRASRCVLPAVAVGRGLPSRHRRGHGLRDAGHRVALPLGAREPSRVIGTGSSTTPATSSNSPSPSAVCSTIARSRRGSSPPDCGARRTSRNRRSSPSRSVLLRRPARRSGPYNDRMTSI